MLSIAGLGKAGSKDAKGKGPIDYYKDVELSKVSYYHGKDGRQIEMSPVWSGKGAAKLGLTGEVGKDFADVEMLAQGFGPKGEELVKGAGDRHRVGHDLTFSANKSVSLAFAMADEQTQRDILSDFQEATHTAIAYLEKHATTRLGEDGHRHEKVAGLVCAQFQHFASRELDPQLHAHVLVFNAAERQDGKFGTLESKAIFDLKMTAGALWRAELASRLAARGFEIEKEGRDNFKVVGIKQEEIDIFSTRRQQIIEELKRKGKSGSQASQNATMATRRAKDEPPLPHLMEIWKRQGAEMGLTEASIAGMKAKGKAKPIKHYELDTKALLSRLTEQHSTFEAKDVIRAIAVDAVGNWDLARCEAEAQSMMEGEGILHLGKGRDKNAPPRFTTAERYELEKAIGLSAENRMKETFHHADAKLVEREVEAQEKEQGFKLNPEQRASVNWICSETGGVAIVEGWAGTGKTTMLTTANRVFKAAGFQTLGTALAGKAAEGLEKESGIPSQTLASLLMQLDSGSRKLDEKTAVVIDEGGMIGSKMFRRLQEHIDLAGSKCVMVGDPKQLQSIEAGGIMRSLMDRIKYAELKDIQRQKTDLSALRRMLKGRDEDGFRIMGPGRREELAKVKDGDLVAWAKGLAAIDPEVDQTVKAWGERSDYAWMRGTVKDFASEDDLGKAQASKAIRELDARGLLDLADNRKESIAAMVRDWMLDPTDQKRKLMLAGTNEEVFQSNLLARQSLIDAGELAVGDGVKSVRFDLNKAGNSYREFVAGDRIVFRQNNSKMGVKNGALGTVEGVVHVGGRAALRVRMDAEKGAGKVVTVDPGTYKSVDYGWCVSVHKSQGVTVDQAYALVNESMADREWTYVAASRSRFRTKLYAVEGDVSHLMDDNHKKLDKADQSVLEREANLKAMGERMGRSRAKDTTLDYEDALTFEQVKRREAEKASGQPTPAAPKAMTGFAGVLARAAQATKVSQEAVSRARAAEEARKKAQKEQTK